MLRDYDVKELKTNQQMALEKSLRSQITEMKEMRARLLNQDVPLPKFLEKELDQLELDLETVQSFLVEPEELVYERVFEYEPDQDESVSSYDKRTIKTSLLANGRIYVFVSGDEGSGMALTKRQAVKIAEHLAELSKATVGNRAYVRAKDEEKWAARENQLYPKSKAKKREAC